MKTLRALALALPLPLLLPLSQPLPPGLPPSLASLAGPPGEALDDPGGDWTLVWDDSLDDVLEDVRKQCRVRLAVVDGRVNGAFVGEVSGTSRVAIFTGEAVGRLVLLQQREANYVCSYQLRVVDDRLEGTWGDSRGSGGTAVLVRELADDESGAPGTGR